MHYDVYDPEDELAASSVPIHRALTAPRLMFGVERWQVGANLCAQVVLLRIGRMQLGALLVCIASGLVIHYVLSEVAKSDPYRIRNYRNALLGPTRLASRSLRRVSHRGEPVSEFGRQHRFRPREVL